MTFNKSRAPLFRTLLGLSLLALALLGATSLCLKEIPLALFGEHASGIVTKVEIIQTSTSSDSGRRGSGFPTTVRRGGESTFMHIDFTTKEGKPVSIKTTATFHTEAKVGDKHPILYLPSNPENAKIYSAKQLWLPMGVGFVFVSVCSYFGMRLLRRRNASGSPGQRFHHHR